VSEPVIAGRRSIKLELKAGTYTWCSCGRSATQPFCDDSHKGTEFTPVTFELTEDRRVSLCLCKRTKTPGICDGTHRTLPPEDAPTP
jgi:CDGSH-type Zn-finger protein